MANIGRNLPQAIQEKGREIRTFMPKLGNINERRNQLHEVIRLSGMNLIIDDTDHPLIIKVASSVSSCFTRSTFALGLSILLTATIISIPAAFAWLIASTVWGITPSSAATTKTAISVAFAPRIRIAVNASCPGVSRKVIA